MKVFTKNARLDTMAVTIQALHVSGKQMTLAVFRQLPVASAYTESGALTAMERWGIVRYSIKDGDDVWLVASHDGRLYRCSTWIKSDAVSRAAYPNVPQEKIDALGKCKSVGSFFATDISNTFNGVKQEAIKEMT